MESVMNTPVSEEMVIIMGGVTKLYLGEIVEVAKEIQQLWGDGGGPLAPCHIREAYRRIRREERTSGGKIALPD
jgi:transcription initiation factor TFIID subunit 11